MDDYFKLVREIWLLLRDSMLDFLEILFDIQGFSDFDKEDIKVVVQRNKIQVIDKF